ncbi:sarcoplasmic calcium-binding protein-like [Lingula anatina]|nr:sarcoplasmic calcium-binding protein-like [Lingula anatina]|eukprot:XP_013421195.1 sarcoplasmic calcium-binding protein-like [Lingula anatina]
MSGVPFPEFWVRKMRSFYVIFDRDLDGLVQREDYVDWPVGRANKNMTPEKAESLYGLVSSAWDVFWAGEEKRKSVTIDQMVKEHSRTFDTQSSFHESLEKWLEICFDDVDANDDGCITLEEYTTFLKCYGVHPYSVTPSFEALDTNHDGLISKEEFKNAGRDYFKVTADTPAKLFWGPFRA